MYQSCPESGKPSIPWLSYASASALRSSSCGAKPPGLAAEASTKSSGDAPLRLDHLLHPAAGTQLEPTPVGIGGRRHGRVAAQAPDRIR